MTQAPTDAARAAAVQAAFEQLRQQFLQGVPARWREITETSSPRDQQAALHRLVGAAGSYGYAEVSERAREVECLFDVPSPDAGALQLGLAALRSELLRVGVTL